MSSFNSLSHEFIDAWLQSEPLASPESLCAGLTEKLTIKMSLSLMETSADDPYDWHFHRLKDFGFKSHLLDWLREELTHATLRDLDRSFVDDAVIPMFSQSIERRRPIIDFVKTRVFGVRLGYERLILPQNAMGSLHGA